MTDLTTEVPIEAWLNDYPDYLDNQEDYIKFRPFFKNIPKLSVGVEVGTYEGYNALGICKYCNPKKLYLVDPYLVYDSALSDTSTWRTQDFWEEIYWRAKEKLRAYPVEFIRYPSVLAAKYVPNELDFVYIDGDHTFDAVFRDIDVWFPKVKEGGLIGGHDILEPEVQEAVKTFFQDLHCRWGWNDWWIQKSTQPKSGNLGLADITA